MSKVLPERDALEKNAVRYMTGYVAVALLKRHNKPTMDTNAGQTEAIESIDDYTRPWSDLIDRGLYHISDKVRLLEIGITLLPKKIVFIYII